MTDLSEQQKPNWKEAFQGKDVVGGETLVNNLLYEDIGTPIYFNNYREEKTHFMVDREVGSEDATIRKKQEIPRKLIGIMLPTSNQNEFVYMGITEGGFVFKASDEWANDFGTWSKGNLGWERFGDYINASGLGYLEKDKPKIILNEEDDPSRFTEIFISAVQKERERMSSVKEKRANTREDLLKKLFGGQQ